MAEGVPSAQVGRWELEQESPLKPTAETAGRKEPFIVNHQAGTTLTAAKFLPSRLNAKPTR